MYTCAPMAKLEKLVFHESVLSPWGGRLGSRIRSQFLPEGTSPRFRTVGSLDTVNAKVAAVGLQPRSRLPNLVADTYSDSGITAAETVITQPPVSSPPSLYSDMPPKVLKRCGGCNCRPAAGASKPGGGGGGDSRTQKNQKPVSNITAISNSATISNQARPHSYHTAAGDVVDGEPEKETTLIELARYPGYTPSRPTPLPHSLDTLEQMRRVTRAQAKIAAKREGYREYWREKFYSTASQTIFLDTFWWFFLERYQPHRAVQSSLFSRVADNYVTFFIRTEVNTWNDKFLKAYPDALAQCVYTAFIHAFPASWSSFDDKFKSALVELVYLWQTGTRPMPELWRRWNYEYLDPPHSLKKIGQEDKPVAKKKKKFDLDVLVEEARLAKKEGVDIRVDNYLREGESVTESVSRPQSPSPSLQRKINTIDLERFLSGKTPHDGGSGEEGFVGETVDNAEKLDVARSQLIHLCTNPPNHDRGKPRIGRLGPSTVSGTDQLLKPSSSPSKSKSKPNAKDPSMPVALPPLSTQGPNKTNTSQSGQPSSAPQPLKSTRTSQTKPGPKQPLSDVREEEEVQSKSKSKCKAKRKKPKVKKGWRATRSTSTSSSTQNNKPLAAPKGKAAPTKPPQTKPTDNGKPMNSAVKYGLPNYIFKEGERTWKEKAVTVREKISQKPISILHKLHNHQGVPLAVPEIESVCFNQSGRSPLVKHFLQKKRLTKSTGYAILTKRTEINQVIPSGAPTYDDVIQESLRESRKRIVQASSQKRQSKKQLQLILQERIKKRDYYKRQLRQLLSATKEVESLSNELVDYWEQRGVDRTQGVASLRHTLSPDMQQTLSTCIDNAFQRCSISQPTS